MRAKTERSRRAGEREAGVAVSDWQRWWLAVAALAAADSKDFLLLSSRQEKTMHNPAAQSNRDHRAAGQ